MRNTWKNLLCTSEPLLRKGVTLSWGQRPLLQTVVWMRRYFRHITLWAGFTADKITYQYRHFHSICTSSHPLPLVYVSISMPPKLSLQWFLPVLRNTEIVRHLVLIAVHKVGYMQHFSSRAVPGSCSRDAGVCLREQVGRSEGIIAAHNINTNTCSKTPQHRAAMESWCPFAALRWCSHATDLIRTEWCIPRHSHCSR